MYTAQSMDSIGDKIRKYRKLRSMSIDDLARQCKITGGYLGRLERWEEGHKNPSIETLQALAQELGITVHELMPTPYEKKLTEYNERIEVRDPLVLLPVEERDLLLSWRIANSEQKKFIRHAFNISGVNRNQEIAEPKKKSHK